MSKHYDSIVIGSGPAGMTAAITIAKKNKKVLVIERNEVLSKKIYATGNGRCNFSNENAIDAKQVIDFCASIGIVAIKEEDRFYPRNREAKSVANAFAKAAEKACVEFELGCIVTDVKKSEEVFVVRSYDREFTSDCLVIATGGKAGIQYGCYGDGYNFAKAFGHSIRKPIPALCGMKTEEDISMLHGVRVHANASIYCNDTLLGSDFGEVQFTKDYISGICVMNLAKFLRLEDGKNFKLVLDMYPECTEEQLLSLFFEQIKRLGCAMEGLVPEKIHEYLHTRITKNEHNPKTMAHLSKNLSFKVTGSAGWKSAQVTSGGISLNELDSNCQSRFVPGLFFAGEVLDYDGPCGGYNIDFAINSGLKVGEYF